MSLAVKQDREEKLRKYFLEEVRRGTGGKYLEKKYLIDGGGEE